MILTALLILLTAPGCVFAVLSIIRGQQFVKRTLQPDHPELLGSWKIEAARDKLLAAIIGCLAFIGIASAVGLQLGQDGRRAVGIAITVGFFVAVLLLDLMAFLNYWLRWGPRR